MALSGGRCFFRRLVAHRASLTHTVEQGARGGPSPQHLPVLTRNLFISHMLALPEGRAGGRFGRNLRDITLSRYSSFGSTDAVAPLLFGSAKILAMVGSSLASALRSEAVNHFWKESR